MSLTKTVQTMAESGCTAAQIAAVVAAHEAACEQAKAAKKAKDAERKRRSRSLASGMSRGHCVTPQDSADKVSPASPSSSFPPIPPLSTTPPSPPSNTHSARADDDRSEAAAYADEIRKTYLRCNHAEPSMYLSNSWRKAGWPIEIVCDVIGAKLRANPTGRFGLNYFENAISDAVAKAGAPVPVGTVASSPPRAGPAAKPISVAAQLTRNLRERNQAHVQPDNVQDQRIIDVTPLARATG